MSTLNAPGAVSELLRSSIAVLKTGKADEAAEYARRASEAKPDDPMPWILLATSELQRGRLMAAKVAIDALQSLGSPKAAGLRQQWAQHRQHWSNTGYARGFEAQRHRYMDSPMAVAIESTGRCNAQCSFCPHPSLERRRTSMEDALFDKLVSDLSDLPSDRPVLIYPNVVNEPFMDRQFFDRFRRLMDAVPSAQLDLITNLNVVPKRFWDELWTLPRVRSIRLSFAAANAPEYEATMGIDFARTVANLRKLLEGVRERGWLKVPVRLTRIADQSDGDRRFAEDCRTVLEGFEPGKDYISEVVTRASWLGAVKTEQTPVPYAMPCMNWLQLSVHATGVIPHCCMDSHAEYAIGDARKDHLLDIYNAPGFRTYRERALGREAHHPCNGCALL